MSIIRIIAVILGLLVVTKVSAQEDAITLVPFENVTFGVQGVIPEGWQNAAPGVYARGASATDATSIIVQSAPMTVDALQGILSSQLGVDTFPEAEGEVATAFGTWSQYRIDNDAVGLSLSLALIEQDGTTYLVLLQSATDEHDSLRDTVFVPVLDSIMLLVAVSEEATEESEVDLPYIEETVTFENGDVTLAGTLSIPAEGDAFPVVVIFSGSGAQNRDGNLEPIAMIEPYADIADYLTRQGIAVLRYDDRGVGESTNSADETDLLDIRDDGNAAVDYLASRDEFTHIGIIGHSEGGVYAPEIALNNDAVDFVVGLNAPTVNLVEVTRLQQRLMLEQAGVDAEEIETIDSAYAAMLDAVASDDDDIIRNAVRDLVTAQSGGEVPNEATLNIYVAQITSAIFQSYIAYDTSSFWLALDVPTLAIFGERDLQVSPEQSIPVIEGNNDNITIVTIPRMNHLLQDAQTGALEEYATLEQTVMPELLETVGAWILEITAE